MNITFGLGAAAETIYAGELELTISEEALLVSADDQTALSLSDEALQKAVTEEEEELLNEETAAIIIDAEG